MVGPGPHYWSEAERRPIALYSESWVMYHIPHHWTGSRVALWTEKDWGLGYLTLRWVEGGEDQCWKEEDGQNYRKRSSTMVLQKPLVRLHWDLFLCGTDLREYLAFVSKSYRMRRWVLLSEECSLRAWMKFLTSGFEEAEINSCAIESSLGVLVRARAFLKRLGLDVFGNSSGLDGSLSFFQ